MARSDRKKKRETLRDEGVLNPRPDSVADELFAGSDFFDPHDIVQVKYEMLRRVRVDGYTVKLAAECFGFSRTSFYHAQDAFGLGGLGALVPKKRGPRSAHKLSNDVLDFLEAVMDSDPSADLVTAVRKKFGKSVHHRSIERALARAKKKPR